MKPILLKILILLTLNLCFCQTETSSNTAAIYKKMDKTISPCENFYKYSCGNYSSNTEDNSNLFSKIKNKNILKVKNILNNQTIFLKLKIHKSSFDFMKTKRRFILSLKKFINHNSKLIKHLSINVNNVLQDIGNDNFCITELKIVVDDPWELIYLLKHSTRKQKFKHIQVLKAIKDIDMEFDAITKMRLFYQSCMSTINDNNQEEIKKLKRIFYPKSFHMKEKENGRFCEENFSSNSCNFLTETLTTFHKMHSSILFVTTPVNKLIHDPSSPKHIITMMQQSFYSQFTTKELKSETNEEEDDDSDDEISNKDRRAISSYKTLIKKILNKLEWEDDISSHDIAMLEYKLSKHAISTKNVFKKKFLPRYSRIYTRSSFQERWEFINLDLYLDKVTSEVSDHIKDEIFVIYPPYFDNLNQILKETSKKTILDYIRFKSIKDIFMKYNMFANLNLSNDYTLNKEESMDQCVSIVNSAFGFAVGHLFIKEMNITPETLKDIRLLSQEIIRSFEDLINHLSWMDHKTKRNALRKLYGIKFFIGIPNFATNLDELNFHYQDIKITPFFFESVISIRISIYNKKMQMLKENYEYKWGAKVNPIEVNAIYNSMGNYVTIPAGIIQRPFYSDRLKYVIFGGLIPMIGHELTHAFDINGLTINDEGVAEKWIDSRSDDKLELRLNSFEHQLIEICTVEFEDGESLHPNFQKTVNELMSDQGGIEIAFNTFKAMRRNNTNSNNDEKLLFVNFAQMFCGYVSPSTMRKILKEDSHPPGSCRANMIMMNTHFRDTFGCDKNRSNSERL